MMYKFRLLQFQCDSPAYPLSVRAQVWLPAEAPFTDPALLRNPAPGAFHPPPALAPAAAAGRNRRRAKMLMVRKKTKSYANAQGIKAVSTKRPLGIRKR